MVAKEPSKRTTGGLIAVEEVPESHIEEFLQRFLCNQPLKSCRSETMAEKAFAAGTMKYRGKNKQAMLDRLGQAIDTLIGQGVFEEYETKTQMRIRFKKK